MDILLKLVDWLQDQKGVMLGATKEEVVREFLDEFSELESNKAETNARIGRTYYQAMTDAAGYPNGMAYWPDLTSQEKYSYTCTGLGFLEMLTSMGMITINQPVGLGDKPEWGEGECKELMDYFAANRAKEKQEFEERIAHLNERLNKNKAG